MNDQHDPARLDDRLTAASRRLRQAAPDEVASRQALARVREGATSPAPAPVRPRWPIFVGLGGAAAAIVVLLAIGLTDRQDSVILPADVPPDVTGSTSLPEPSATDAPTTPSTTGPASTEPDTSPPDTTSATTEPPATGEPAPTTTEVGLTLPTTLPADCATAAADVPEMVACLERPQGPTLIVDDAETGDWVVLEAEAEPRVVGTPNPLPGEVDGWWFVAEVLPPGTPEDGPSLSCLVVVPSDGDGWRQRCDPAEITTSTVTILDDRLVQLDIEASEVVVALPLAGGVWPASGCDAAAMAGAAAAIVGGQPWALLDSFRCEGGDVSLLPESPARAVASAGSAFVPAAAPDGSIFVAERSDGVWQVTDFGTGIEEAGWSIPNSGRWTSWPGDTAPLGGPKAIGELGTTSATLEGLAGDVTRLIAEPTADETEFPTTVELVDTVEFDPFRALIIVRTSEPGDDSVDGFAYFVWARSVRTPNDTTEWRVEGSEISQICARGGDLTSPLCA